MRVVTTVVGAGPDRPPAVVWPEDWPVPRTGDDVGLVGMPLSVRAVVWYPHGDSDTAEPFVYLVLTAQP